MGSLSEKFKLDGNRFASIAVVLQTVRGIARWLAGFFTLTKEDRSKAGIYRGGQGRSG